MPSKFPLLNLTTPVGKAGILRLTLMTKFGKRINWTYRLKWVWRHFKKTNSVRADKLFWNMDMCVVGVTTTNREKSICKKKMFIPCKPHRARAQPRSDLGRNRAVTVGIENKKQKHFSIRSTISWRNNWLNCNFHISFQEPMTAIRVKEASPFYSRWKPHAQQRPFRMMVKPHQTWVIFSLQENNTQTEGKLL